MESNLPAQPPTVGDTVSLPEEQGNTMPWSCGVSPGFVVVRDLLGLIQQMWLACYALLAGQDESRGHSFWINMLPQHWGHIYYDIETFPSPDSSGAEIAGHSRSGPVNCMHVARALL